MLKALLRWFMGLFYIGAGVGHFLWPQFYLQIMPPYLPWHGPLVAISGVAEILLGVLVLIPATQRLAAWGIIALLIAVFPANLYMATANVQLQNVPQWMSQPSPAARWGRLPFQLVFIAWAYWFTRPKRPPAK